MVAAGADRDNRGRCCPKASARRSAEGNSGSAPGAAASPATGESGQSVAHCGSHDRVLMASDRQPRVLAIGASRAQGGGVREGGLRRGRAGGRGKKSADSRAAK